jgi:hypothetical protein
MASSFDRALLSTVDAAYQLDGSTDDWLRRIVHCARPALAPDLGVIGTTMRLQADRGPTFTSAMVTTGNVPAGVVDFIRALSGEHMPDYVQAAIVSRATLDTASSAYERPPRTCPVSRLRAARSPSPARHSRPARRAGLRRRRARVHAARELRQGHRPAATPERALGARDGSRVRGPAPARRARVARGRDRAWRSRRPRRRGRQAWRRARGAARRRDRDRPRAQPSRWSLVEAFESDGRRYLVARKNDPKVDYPRALSERERQVATRRT